MSSTPYKEGHNAGQNGGVFKEAGKSAWEIQEAQRGKSDAQKGK
ncbi:hypothetical protein [Phenylobacterium sp.]|jgi:hypothetical protein